jgi:hypothetical protein
MKRAEFLKVLGGGSLAALAGSVLTSCKSGTTTPTNPTSKAFTSTTANGHAHTFTVQKAEVDTPPAGGISRQTSAPTDAYSGNHTHAFTMTQADLTSVKNGTSVTISSGDYDAGTGPHHHDFTISKWY